ncbi:serine/arginine repetitive matrix protein 1-like isoform X2 [Dysidea avara]|uniref:serine/arginine repetitive matrix protein 1-like isoform X2 n=1 Tax=Dysidea avara TaxID=196820 RepID=UPI00333304AF
MLVMWVCLLITMLRQYNDIHDNKLAGVWIKNYASPIFHSNAIHHGKDVGFFIFYDGQGILEDNDIHTNRITGIEIKQDANPIVMKCRIHHCCTGGVYIHDRVSCVSLSPTNDDMESELRHHCAYNIPVAAILRCDAMKIAPLYIKLMKDKSLTILEGLIEHLPQAMLEFANAANLSVTTKLSCKTTFMEEDPLDQKKEQEEKLLLLAEEQEAKEPDNSSKGKQSATSKDKQKNPPTKHFTSPLRMTSSANTPPYEQCLRGLSNSLTTTLPSPSTTGPSTSAGGSSGSGGTSPAAIMKAVTIPKIVTPVSGSPGLQKRETFHGSTRGTKTPVPSETKSQPSLDTKGLTSSPRSSPSELRKTKPKDDKVSSRSAPSTSKRKPLSSGGRGTKWT